MAGGQQIAEKLAVGNSWKDLQAEPFGFGLIYFAENRPARVECLVLYVLKPALSIADCASGFFMNVCHTNWVR